MNARKKAPASPAIVPPTLGFGVPASNDPHHFVVAIPRGNSSPVSIIENLGMQSHDYSQSQILRCVLQRPRWTAIRSETQRAFNSRLKERGLKTSLWQVGENPLDRLLGKELCVLAWACEGLAPDHIGIAVRNWLALRPEERWWLFGMTALTTGTAHEGGKGWRLALRHALGDMAQSQIYKPYHASQAPANIPSSGQDTLSLFDIGQ